MVVFCAQLEVAHYDRDLGACYDEDDEDQHQETEDIVELQQERRNAHPTGTLC